MNAPHGTERPDFFYQPLPELLADFIIELHAIDADEALRDANRRAVIAALGRSLASDGGAHQAASRAYLEQLAPLYTQLAAAIVGVLESQPKREHAALFEIEGAR